MKRDGDHATDNTLQASGDVTHGTASGASTIPEPDADAGLREGVLDRYKLGEVLGRGGMGEVVSARDEQLGRSVAIKRMRAADPSPEAVARFLREARVQGRLDHPAVVPVHELRHDDHGRPYFVMKQLTGVTLETVLGALAAHNAETDRRFSRQRLLRAFAEVCLAVEFAHTRGIVHRDLKPANIVLGDFGEVYVLDWGIARVMDEGTSAVSFADVDSLELGATLVGAVLGTPGYMSPEQIEGRAALDGRADVYALGCILFEILARVPLHPRGSHGLTSALAGLGDARPSVRAAELDLPPELDAICLTATMTAPADRYATARSLGDAVQQFLDGDRDLALRKELSRVELVAARAALARGDGPEDRRVAIRAAARALALDPHAREPAELVGRLMLEPPSEVPVEVEREIDAIERHAMTGQAALAARATVAYLAFFPILYACGFRTTWYLVVGPALVGMSMLAANLMARRPARWVITSSIVLNFAVIAMFSRILSPFLVAPCLGVVTGMMLAMHPRTAPAWALATGLVVAVLGPWLLERVGVLGGTTSVVGNHVVLVADAEYLDPTLTLIGLTLYTAVMLGMAVMLSRVLANNRQKIQRVVQIQAWQLRQLVPPAAI
ncbi:MAG: serine/threonine-protein kinase [Proteobacteria bacterium]|nr:serine/threonine-protein kinase [Pseudomonadota bacterium]